MHFLLFSPAGLQSKELQCWEQYRNGKSKLLCTQIYKGLEDLGILHLETRSTLKIIFRPSIWNLKFIRGLWRPQRGFLYPPLRKAKYYIYLISSMMRRSSYYNNLLYADIRKRSAVHSLLTICLCLYSYFTQSKQLLACFSIEPWVSGKQGLFPLMSFVC